MIYYYRIIENNKNTEPLKIEAPGDIREDQESGALMHRAERLSLVFYSTHSTL